MATKKNIAVIKLPETWEEYCEAAGTNPLLLPDTSLYDEKDKRHAVADFKLTKLIRYCNGKDLDYTDSSYPKYEAYWWIVKDKTKESGLGLRYNGCDVWHTNTCCGPRFAFISPLVRDHIVKYFIDLIEDLIL